MVESGSSAPRTIGVQARMSLLLATTAAVFVSLILAVHWSRNRQVDLLLRERAQETDRVLQRILELRASGARIHADDYTRWDDFVTFTRKPDPLWGSIYLTESISTFGIDIAWVLDERFNLIFCANPQQDPALHVLPVPLPQLASSLRVRPIQHFFAPTSKGLLEVWSSPIQPSEDFARETPSSGYYIIGRVWTPLRMEELAKDANGTARIVPPPSNPVPPSVSAKTGDIAIMAPLHGFDGQPLAAISFETRFPVVSRVHDALRLSAVLMLAGVCSLLLTIWFALSRWVGRPLASITEALRREDHSLLRSSTARNDELGHLARLVEEFFAQRRKLIEAREAAEVAMRAKSQFLANISHELRTPMHGILSYSRFGLREATTAEREELLDNFRNIEECGTSLLVLLNDLLDLAKFDAGRMKFEFAQVTLDEIINEAADEFASLYEERELTLEVSSDHLHPLLADRMKILQLLRNLLSNAAKFSPPGGKVTLHAAADGSFVRVIVEDSGVGIPDNELELIFDKFAQASHTNPHSDGTGLGLSICREIVVAHEGRIWAENRPGGGARFTIELPFEGPAAAHESIDESGTPLPENLIPAAARQGSVLTPGERG